jgi:hypothetical protein
MVATINSFDSERREQAAERMRPQLEKMNQEIDDQRDLALLEADGMALAIIHADLARHMQTVEKKINKARSVVNVVDDGTMELTLADGRKLSAQRKIKREL